MRDSGVDLDAGMTYLDFVEARHQVWQARQLGAAQSEWTQDPILASRKFTNVFRVLDPGSQFVLTDLAADDPDPRDLLMRIFLYRHTGRVEVWRYLQAQMGGYPTVDELDEVLEVFKEYRGGSKVITCGTKTVGGGSRKGKLFDKPIFTSAYLVFPQSAVPGTDKLESVIGLTKRLFNGTMPERFFDSPTQETRFAVLRGNKGVADFMSMQILTDWGYVNPGPAQLEDEFVVAGPGAVKGARVLAPNWKAVDVISWAVEAIRSSPSCPVIGDLRVPSYMDAQNTLCEFSKYVRYMEKPSLKPYVPAHPGAQPPPVLPKHW